MMANPRPVTRFSVMKPADGAKGTASLPWQGPREINYKRNIDDGMMVGNAGTGELGLHPGDASSAGITGLCETRQWREVLEARRGDPGNRKGDVASLVVKVVRLDNGTRPEIMTLHGRKK